MHFTDAEVGLYVRLLCVEWSKGKLPSENHELSSYGKPSTAGDTPIERVKAKFMPGDDSFLRNERMEHERMKQEAYRKSRSDNGKQGGRPTKPHANHMVLKPKAQESSPSPSPSPSPYAEREPHFPEVNGYPTLDEVKSKASIIGLSDWKAEDWFNEMQGCGWLDHQHRPIQDWCSVLTRVKVKWESDGRPKSPPKSNYSKTPSETPKFRPAGNF